MIDELKKVNELIEKHDKPLVEWDLIANRKYGFRIAMFFNGEYVGHEFYREWTHNEFFAFMLGMYPSEVKMKLTKDDLIGEYFFITIPYRETINF